MLFLSHHNEGILLCKLTRPCWVARDVCHADGASSGELACHLGNIEGVCILDVRGKHVNMEYHQSFPSLVSTVPGLGTRS